MNLDGGPDLVVGLARLSGGFLSASSVATVDGGSVFDCFDGAFSHPEAIGFTGCKRCRPFAGSANPTADVAMGIG